MWCFNLSDNGFYAECPAHIFFRDNFAGCAKSYIAGFVQQQSFVGMAECVYRIVGVKNTGDSLFSQAAQSFQYNQLIFKIQIAFWFIQNNNLWFSYDCTGNQYHLQFTTG